MDLKDKIKNIKDLQHNRILNYQNLFVATFAGAIIATTFAENIPFGVSKTLLISSLTLLLFASLVGTNIKLRKIIKDVESI